MREIDLTKRIEKPKGAKVLYQTVYVNDRGIYYGFPSTGEMDAGISFVRLTKRGIKRHRNGTTKWYFGSLNDLRSAVSKVRMRYGLKMPVGGWSKVRVKVYNITDVEQLITALNDKEA